MSNVTIDVVPHGLCIGCGTCVAICPKNSLKIEVNNEKGLYEPILIEDKCTDCGMCLRVCPGIGFGYRHAKHINYYLGYSNDQDIRYNCSSGGLITQILIFMLEQRIIDGALVTRMKRDSPLEPEPFIARTKEEILEASKSKYCPVPANIALKDIINSKKEEKFAVVGLPCHIAGAIKAEEIDKELKEKIVFHLGLVCNHAPTFHATEFIIDSYNLNTDEINEIKYRGEGWPSGMKITNKRGECTFIPHFDHLYWGHVFNSFFVPKRCGLCDDKECRNSDIAFADAWIPEIMSKDPIGSSIMVSRKMITNDLLQKAEHEEVITLSKVSQDMFLRSQSLDLVKRKAYARINLLRIMRRKTPSWNAQIPECTFLDYVDSVMFFIRNYYFSKSYHYNIIRIYCKLIQKALRVRLHLMKRS